MYLHIIQLYSPHILTFTPQNKNTYHSVLITAKKNPTNKLYCALSVWFITWWYILSSLSKLECKKMLRFYTLVFPVHWSNYTGSRKPSQAVSYIHTCLWTLLLTRNLTFQWDTFSPMSTLKRAWAHVKATRHHCALPQYTLSAWTPIGRQGVKAAPTSACQHPASKPPSAAIGCGFYLALQTQRQKCYSKSSLFQF